jgi:hypothetical protein
MTIASDSDANRLRELRPIERRRYPPGIAGITSSHHTSGQKHIVNAPGDCTLD